MESNMNASKIVFVFFALFAFTTALSYNEKKTKLRSVLQDYESIRMLYENMTELLKKQQNQTMYALNVCRANSTRLACDLKLKTVELEKYEIDTKEKQRHIEQLNDKCEATNRTLLDVQERYKNSTLNIENLQLDLNSRNAQLDSKDAEIKEKNISITNLNNTINDLRASYQQLQEKSINDSIKLEENSKTIETLQLNVTQSTANIDRMSKEIQELKDQLSASKIRIGKLKNTISSFEASCQIDNCEKFGTSTEVHLITVKGMEEQFQVRCDGQLHGPGWTVIQSRINGEVNFYRNWTEYKTGFGNLSSEYFIGLERLHQMTTIEPQVLYIHLEDFEGKTRYAEYNHFVVGNESESYAITELGEFQGDVRDRLDFSAFSTFDRDNDADANFNCAEKFHGGWWYSDCGLT